MKSRYAVLVFFSACLVFVAVIYNINDILLQKFRPKLTSVVSGRTDIVGALRNCSKLHWQRSSTTTDGQKDRKILLVFWSKLWGRQATKLERVWRKGEGSGKCPVTCELTSNRSRSKQGHAFIVHARDPKPLPPYKSVPWILTTHENPVYTPVLRDPKYMKQFHLLDSYRLDSDFPTPRFTKPDLVAPVPFKNKTGGIMAAFSNCEPVRTEYLKQLMKFVKVDSYGFCLKNKQGLIPRNGNYFKVVKTKLARSYKFMTVFFNQDCDYFVDDQILHAMNAGAVPIVISTDKIMEFLPGNLKHSIINVRDFKSPKHLADHLKFLSNNEREYNKYLEWKTKGLGDLGETVIGKHWDRVHTAWCQMCVAVSQCRWHREGLKPIHCKPRKYSDWGIIPGH